MSTTAIGHARHNRSLGLRGHVVSHADTSTLLYSIMEARFNSKLTRFVAFGTRAAPPILLLGPRIGEYSTERAATIFTPPSSDLILNSVTISGALL